MKVVQKIVNSPGFRQTVLLTGGNVFASGISAVSLILISRFLGPADFGVFSVAFSLSMLLSRLFDFGLNMTLQKFLAQNYQTNQNRANQVFTVVLQSKLILMATLLVVGFFFGPPLAQRFFHLESVTLIRLSIALTLVTYSYEFLTVIFQSIHKFGVSVLLSVSQAVAKMIVIGAYFFLNVRDVMVVYASFALSPIVTVPIGAYLLPKWLKTVPVTKDVKQAMGKMTRFTAIAIIAAAIGDHIDVLMVQSYLSEYQTGLYAAASRVSLLMAIVAFSLGTVLNSRVARYQDSLNLQKYLKKAMAFMGAAILGIFAVMPFASIILELTAGPEYLEAAKALEALLAAGMLVIATVPLIALFYAIDKPEYFALSGIIQTIVLVGANAILIPQLGIIGSGYARVITRAVIFIFSLLYALIVVRKKFNLKPENFLPNVKEMISQ